MSANENRPLRRLENNQRDVFSEASRILIKIADNILLDPSSLKVRILHKSNNVLSNKLFCVEGGVAYLKAMGFIEEERAFLLPLEDSLDELIRTRNDLARARQKQGFTPSDSIMDLSPMHLEENVPTTSNANINKGAIPKKKVSASVSTQSEPISLTNLSGINTVGESSSQSNSNMGSATSPEVLVPNASQDNKMGEISNPLNENDESAGSYKF